MSLDYAALGFKAGLEIHQQLDTPKLFCSCGSRLDEDDAADVAFVRDLRPTASELGEIDRAAVEEARKALRFAYVGSRRSACLVEMDEEPPHAMTREAVEVALQTALLLAAKPVDEVHVMRKIVVDGSNTGGFQRTSLLATEGVVESAEGNVRVATLCLEEDSARRLDREGNVQRYRLDRLGIPLVEIATEPDLKSGAQAREVAEAIGAALRATGRVKRGIGTIRQDLNVSVREGARVEIKGVQELRLIETAVDWEVRRQVHLLDVKKQLLARGAAAGDYLRPAVDVADVFAHTKAKTVAAARDAGQAVLAAGLPHLAGLLGKKGDEALPPPRVGRELADHAKVKAGVKGIFHGDELPAYGVSAEEVAAVRARLGLAERDSFALVVERREVAERALEAVLRRAAALLDGVPEETRDLNPDGTSRYLRPLPGGARMYPETDVPPVRLDAALVAKVRASLPELPKERLARLQREHPDLSPEQARQLVRGGRASDFEALARTGLPKEAARLLLSTTPELVAKGVPEEKLGLDVLLPALEAVKAGAFAKEALPQVVERMAREGQDARAAAAALGLGAADESAVLAFLDELLDKEADLVARQGMRATGPLMGPLMARFKGQVAGSRLSALLAEKLAARAKK
ncbi:MAG TPA: Glu-tRNA(Gln) amidotransferase subunit GatE [Candidatus Thermoplasmatota archaeon]|nr:Glu-tRNA(Gln) amidotransferase subunit GatE [Candidatus Thermoplasmatota archaeon]